MIVAPEMLNRHLGFIGSVILFLAMGWFARNGRREEEYWSWSQPQAKWDVLPAFGLLEAWVRQWYKTRRGDDPT